MLHVDGELSGIIHSESIVVIGKNGNLKGELQADKSKFGQVMGTAKSKLGNRADGKLMSDIVKRLLGV